MQQQKVSVSKRFLSVDEVARELAVKKFLVKFWEKEFKLNLERSRDENRCYSQENLKAFIAIKDLVHNKKMSLSQAKKQLNAPTGCDSFVAAEQDSDSLTVGQPTVEQAISVQPAVTPADKSSYDDLFKQNLQTFKEQLMNFKQLLDLD